jgi:hypothetical protein
MRFIADGNPGVGTSPGPEWIDEPVAEIAHFSWTHYFRSDDPNFELELKALLILGIVHGVLHEGWIASRAPSLFALALSCYDIRWQPGLLDLAGLANNFILKMRENFPFWRDIPLLQVNEVQLPSDSTFIARILASAPALCRIPLLAMVEKKTAAPLINLGTYAMRSLGLHMREAGPNLIECGVCQPTLDTDAVASLYTKKELIAAMAIHSVPYGKSWNKRRLMETFAFSAPSVVAEAAERGMVSSVAPAYVPGLLSLRCYANALEDCIKPLGLALSKPRF